MYKAPKRNVITGKPQHRIKWLVPVILAILLACAVGMIVYAATNKSLTGNLNVTEGSTDIGFYSDSAGTVPMTSVEFGDVSKGTTSVSRTIYVKNLGTVPITIICGGATGLATGITFNNGSPPSHSGVAVSGVVGFTVSVSASPSAVTGASSFNINFTGA